MNKLIHGECLEEIDKLIKQGIKVDAIITDPPYGVGFSNNSYNDENSYIVGEMGKRMNMFYNILKNNSYLFIFVGVKTIHQRINEGINKGFEYKNIIATRAFNNGNKNPPNNFGFEFYPILVFSKGRGKNFNRVDAIPTSKARYNDKRNKNPKPYTYEYPNFIKSNWFYATEKRNKKKFHPNEKNIKLLEFISSICTNKGDTILDPFMGSGTTGIACQNISRKFIGIEKDINYYNIAVDRIK